MLQLHPPGLFRVRSGFLVIAMTLLTWSHTAQSGTPGGLSARPGDRKIELSWSYVDAPVTWNVKRSLSDSGPYSLISSLRTNAFSDTSVSNGIPYYYRITISWPDLGQNMALYHAVGLDTLSQWMQFGHKPHLSFTPLPSLEAENAAPEPDAPISRFLRERSGGEHTGALK